MRRATRSRAAQESTLHVGPATLRLVSADLKRTPLYEQHRALSARIIPFAGWEMPVQYAGLVEEHHAVRGRAGLFDVSHMGELWLRGKGSIEAVDALVTNGVAHLAIGKAAYTCACNAAGKILDDLIVYRLAPEETLVVCNAGNLEKMSAHFAAHTPEGVDFQDESATTALLSVQGPRALDVLRDAGLTPALLGLGRFAVGRGSLGATPVLVARTGYTGEDGFELFCRAENGAELWQAVLAAGAAYGIAPVGLGARDTLRLEAGLTLYGNDIDETTSPLEAGLDRWVKLDGRDFLGADALRAERKAGLSRKLVGLRMVGRGIARHGYPVVNAAGQSVGVVTSGSPAPSLGQNIGLAYVPPESAEIGSALTIEIRQKPVEACVVRTPFYKRAP
jgi:aminomethyltransferase